MNNFIKSFTKKLFYNLGINLELNSSSQEVKEFILRFKEKLVSTKLIRIGGEGDGGYLVPNVLEDIDFCFSAGVGEISKFEKELSETYNIKSFMADASVIAPKITDNNLIFDEKFISSKTSGKFITLKDWIINSVGNMSGNKILQMDIETSEYEVLSFESSDSLAEFSLMIVEFHKLQNLSNQIFLKMINAIFEKIFKNFYICHVHPNNFSGEYTFKGLKIPSSLEVTFIRKDLIAKCKSDNKTELPNNLDKKNVQGISDLKMPEIWWKD